MTQGLAMSTDSDTVSSTSSSPPPSTSPWILVEGEPKPLEDVLNGTRSPETGQEEQTEQIGHTKLKKRVSFPLSDNELVSIREIPSRNEFPLDEELVPCDPEKLVEEMENVIKTESPRRYECSAKNSGRSMNIVAEITGLNIYGSSFSSRSVSKIAAKQFSQSLRKSKDISDHKSVERSNRHKKLAIKQLSTEDISDKLRVASLKDKPHRTSKRIITSGKKERERTKKQKSPTGEESGVKRKNKVLSFEPLSHRGDIKSNKNKTKQTLNVDSSNLSSSEPLVLPEVFSSRLLTSPYKQSYGNFPEVQQRPHSTPSFASHVKTESGFIFPDDTNDVLRIKSAGHRPQEISIEKPSVAKAKQKVYAWNMANGAAMETTPCIAPMWDVTKLAQTADFLKIT